MRNLIIRKKGDLIEYLVWQYRQGKNTTVDIASLMMITAKQAKKVIADNKQKDLFWKFYKVDTRKNSKVYSISTFKGAGFQSIGKTITAKSENQAESMACKRYNLDSVGYTLCCLIKVL